MKHSENKAMYDRMRARRARIMKRLDAKSASNSNSNLKTHYAAATQATGEVTGGQSGRVFDLTMIIYLILLCVPFLIAILGFMGHGANLR